MATFALLKLLSLVLLELVAWHDHSNPPRAVTQSIFASISIDIGSMGGKPLEGGSSGVCTRQSFCLARPALAMTRLASCAGASDGGFAGCSSSSLLSAPYAYAWRRTVADTLLLLRARLCRHIRGSHRTHEHSRVQCALQHLHRTAEEQAFFGHQLGSKAHIIPNDSTAPAKHTAKMSTRPRKSPVFEASPPAATLA